MLQGRIWVRGTGKAGEWEALTQGAQGEKTCKFSAPYLLRVFPPFCAQSCGQILTKLKFKWSQSVAWLNFGANLCSVTCQISACAFPAPL